MEFEFTGREEITISTTDSILKLSAPVKCSLNSIHIIGIEAEHYSFQVRDGSQALEGIGVNIKNAAMVNGELPLPASLTLKRNSGSIYGDMTNVLKKSNVAIARFLSHRISVIDHALRTRLSINATQYEINVKGAQSDLDLALRHIESMVKREFNLSESDPVMCDCSKGDYCPLWENGAPREVELIARNARIREAIA